MKERKGSALTSSALFVERRLAECSEGAVLSGRGSRSSWSTLDKNKTAIKKSEHCVIPVIKALTTVSQSAGRGMSKQLIPLFLSLSRQFPADLF